MRRRRTGRRSLFLLAVILAAAFGAVCVALKHKPAFYAASEHEPDRLDIAAQSSRLMTRVQDLFNDVGTKAEWGATFEAGELNCFFDEYATDVNARLGGNIHTPRIGIAGDRVSLGVRSGRGPFSTILWVELRAWLVKAEPNCLAVEIEGIRAGLIPIAGQSILDRVTEAARESNIDVSWYRNDGKPVGLFRFFADQARRTPKQIRSVQVREGQLRIAGRSILEGSAVPAGTGPAFGSIE